MTNSPKEAQEMPEKKPGEPCPRCSDLYYHPKTMLADEKQRAAEWEDVAKAAEKKLRRAVEALKFYANRGGPSDTHERKGCWILLRRFVYGEAVKSDYEMLPIGETETPYAVAGKRAREALRELGEL